MNILFPQQSLTGAAGSIVIPPTVYGPLGAYERSKFHVLLTEPRDGRPGEIIFSTLDLSRWHDHVKIVIRNNSQSPFVKATVPRGWSIVLAETYEISGESSTHMMVVLDTSNREIAKDAGRLAELTECVSEESDDIEVTRFTPLHVKAWWITTASLKENQLVLTGNSVTSWRALNQAQLALADGSDLFDPGQYAVVIDTEVRFGRIYFLKRTARSFNVEIDDRPGAVSNALRELQDQEYRVLTSYIKQKQPGCKAMLSVTVESTEDQPQLPSPLFGHSESSGNVFISHAHADSLAAYNLNSVIERGFGGRLQTVCTSLRRLPLSDTDDLFRSLGTLIRESSVFILLVSSLTLNRQVVLWELTYVRQKHAKIVFCKVPGLHEDVMDKLRNVAGSHPEYTLTDGGYEVALIKLIAEHTGVNQSDG